VACLPSAVSLQLLEAVLRSELNTHLAPQALFTQSSPVCRPLLQAFSFPSILGEVTPHPLSQACMFIYSSHRKWVFLPLLWNFPPTAAFISFPVPACWACAAAPAGQCVCLQLTWEVGLPPSPVEFTSLRHSHKLSCSRLLGVHPPPIRASPARPSLFIYSSGKDSPPTCSELRAPHPLCHVSLLFFLLITQFLFFPQVGVCLSRELC
jgi:hypothetical protein